MMTDEDFIDRLSEILSEDQDDNPMARFLLFVRVGIEFGCLHMGPSVVAYLLSRMLSTLVGTASGLFPATFNSLIEELTSPRGKHH
jgi:hypothetical protein